MILFPNKDVNHVLEKAGYRETLLRWFVPIKNLRLELKKLNKENLVLEGFALKNIEHYLISKMTVDYWKQTARIINQKEQEGNLYNAVERVYRRRKNTRLGKTIRIDNLDDAVVNFQFVVLEEELQKYYPASYRLKAKKKLRSLYLLKVQHEELLTLINTIFPIKQKSQTDWFLSLKDLFSLFALEEQWTKEAFENEKSIYENNFNKYIALKIKKLTGFKGSKHDPSQFLFRLGKPA
jgi:hypothetical protein